MKHSLHCYTETQGWNKPLDSTLDSPNTLLIVFSSSRHSVTLRNELEKLGSMYPQSIIMGCSSAGEIFDEDLLDDSITLAVIRFDNTRLKLAQTTIENPEQSSEAGKIIANELLEDGLSAMFTLTDGLLVNGSDYISGLNRILDENIVITGGMAADGDRFEETWLICGNKISPGMVAAVGFYGERFHIAHGSRGGWDLLGHEREVTRAENNVLYSLDSQPALDVYKKYLGERAAGLPATGLLFPLAISNHESDKATVRTILGINEEKKSITFAGNIPEGSYVKLMRANFDRLIDGAAGAAENLVTEDYDGSAAVCIAISCVGRRLVLGPRIEEELEAVREVIPDNSQLLGYYSYGEISPLGSGRCDLHNQTMTLTLFWEHD